MALESRVTVVAQRPKPGQWATYETRTRFGNVTHVRCTHLWVDAVADDGAARVRAQPLDLDRETAVGPGRPIDGAPDVRPARRRILDGTSFGFTEEELVIAGKRVRCKVEVSGSEGGDGTWTVVWRSSEVPLDGTVRVLLLDEDANELTRTELVDWGLGGGVEKPFAVPR